MNWKNLLGSIFLSVAGFAFAQKASPPTCYFDQLVQQHSADPAFNERLDEMRTTVREYLRDRQGQPVLKNGTADLVIPVVVYIVHNNGAENISDMQVMSQMNVLNSYFDPYGIRFCLATTNGAQALPGITTPGIIRIQNAALTDLNADTEHAAIAATSTLPSSRFLRIWVVQQINGGTVGGFSMLPATAPPALDGIVMDANMFGNASTCGCTNLHPSYQNGRILVHEVGHYLGLNHTFHGGCVGMNSATCDEEGDEVCDTPPVASPNSGCSPINSCNETPNLPDHINNYMDYTSESCLTDFTNGQRDRMHAMIALYRSQLVSSQNHAHTGISCNAGLLAGFTADNFAPCIGTSVTFTAAVVSGATYTWDFGDGTTGSGQVATHTYSSVLNPGSVVLTVSLGGNSVSAIQTIFVEACTPIQSSEAHWYFYNRKALDFSSGAPVYDNSAFANNTFSSAASGVNEMSAVQSDANGNLLFYTDGLRIWNNAHAQITGAMHGNYSSKNGVMIIPDPAGNGQYYVLTSDARGTGTSAGRGFKYTKVQVTGTTATLVPGQLNIPITAAAVAGLQVAPTTNAVITGESISAVRHATGYWIIVSGLVNGTGQELLIFNITAGGLAYHGHSPISTLQSPLSASQFFPVNIQSSPDGKRVLFASGAWSGEPDFVFDFDRCAGTVSNQRQLPAIVTNSGAYEFSPNSKLLYAEDDLDIVQLNLETCTIEARVVGSIPSGAVTSLQRGPDNKIYGIIWQTSDMITIHRPNILASASAPNACQFTPTGPATPNNLSMSSGLPNMIDANTLPVYTNAITASVNRCAPQCNTLRFDADLCAPAYSWNFGDPASGANNTSALAHPSHTFSSNGTYTVTLTANGSTYTTSVTVGISPAIAGSLTICPQVGMTGSYTAVIPSGYTILWSVSGGTVSGLSNQPEVSVNWTSLPGTVTLTLTDNETGCTSTRTITVTEYCAPSGCPCNMTAGFNYAVNETNCGYHFYGAAGGSSCLQNFNYYWNFGDGTTATGQTTSHIFSSPGTYTVCMTATASGNGTTCSQSYCLVVNVSCSTGVACDCKDLKPDFHIDNKDCVFTFEGTSGSEVCNENTVYFWDFGDGTSATGNTPQHVYAAPGGYVVCLTVVLYDNDGNELCSEEICHEVGVDCTPPPCDCKYLEPNFTVVNDNCTFDFYGTNGTPPCDPNTVYTWDFGDGTTGTGPNPSHVYPAPGVYYVCMNAVLYDNDGKVMCAKDACHEVVAECTPPPCDCKDLEPEFTYTVNPNTCIFSFSGTGNVPACALQTEYEWSFGDGNISVGPNVGHVYAAPGDYHVCLKVTVFDADGKVMCSDEYCDLVRVECTGSCDCKLEPSFTIVGGGNCDLIFGATSGSDCVDIDSYDWYVNGNYEASGQLFNYQFGVNTNYHVCVVAKGHTAAGQCDVEYCADYFFTDCYPIWPLPKGMSTEPVIGLHPNPAGKDVTISYTADAHDGVTIVFRSADGRLLSEAQPLNSGGAQQTRLDIPSSVANGFVFVEITIGNRRYVEKLLILRD